MKIKLALATIGLATATVAPAQMVTAANPQSVVAALQAGGYKAQLDKDSTGDPRITSAATGSRFVINFYGCTNNVQCKTLTFYAGWTGTKATVGDMNEWNKTKRFSRGYIDKDGDPVMEFDLDLDDGGMSTALFQDNVEFWEASMGAFKKHIGM